MSDSTVLEIWRQREAWAREARDGKKRQEAARFSALLCGVAGALLGTVAGSATTGRVTLGILSAVLIALAGYLGRELLTPERETHWARARLLAEALQRECWRYLMRLPPFDSPEAAVELQQRAADLMGNLGLERGSVQTGREVKLPTPAGIEDYIKDRALAQAEWYETRSGTHRQERRRYGQWTFFLGAFAVAASVVGSSYPRLLAFVPVVTTATAALVAWIQGNRIGSLVALYQETATQLRLQIAAWHDKARERQKQPPEEQIKKAKELVERCEGIMARENGSWRAEWLSTEKAQQVLATHARVEKEAARAATPSNPQ